MSKRQMIGNFRLQFPLYVEDVVEYSMLNANEMLVYMNDGSRFLYDDIDKTIRRLPNDSMSMTELECRSEFGYRLRKIMERKGITQSELSERTGIPQPQLSDYMIGKKSPSFYRVDLIAKALDCSIDDLRYVD